MQIKTFDPTKEICITWHILDVKDVRPDLTDEQALAVLHAVENDHPDIGITFDILHEKAEELFPLPIKFKGIPADKDIGDLELSVRTVNLLRKAGIQSLFTLISYKESQLRQFGINGKGLLEIRGILKAFSEEIMK